MAHDSVVLLPALTVSLAWLSYVLPPVCESVELSEALTVSVLPSAEVSA